MNTSRHGDLTFYLNCRRLPVPIPCWCAITRRLRATGSYVMSMVRFNRPARRRRSTCSSLVEGAVSGILGGTQYTLRSVPAMCSSCACCAPTRVRLFRPGIDIFDRQGTTVTNLAGHRVARGTFTAPVTGTYLVDGQRRVRQLPIGNLCAVVLRLNRPCGAAEPCRAAARLAGDLSRCAGLGGLHLQRGPGRCVYHPHDR